MSLMRRLFPIIFCLLCIGCPADLHRQQFVQPVMGTDLAITIEGVDNEAMSAAATAAEHEMQRINDLMTTWVDASPLSKLNAEAANGWTPTDPEIVRLLELAAQTSIATDGAFDVTAGPLVRLWGFFARVEQRPPSAEDIQRSLDRIGYTHIEIDAEHNSVRFQIPGMEIDFGGIAKGYAVDRARELLSARGVKTALVNLGGNISFIGLPAGRNYWNIAVRDPRGKDGLIGTLTLDADFIGHGIASSGQYERFFMYEGKRYGHIIDPRSGYPAEGVYGTTIIAHSAVLADVLSTATFVLGAEKAETFIRTQKDVEGMIILPAGENGARIRISAALKEHFTLAENVTGVTIETF